MPKLIRLYIVSILIGFGLSVAFVALLVGLDVAGLRHLVLDTDGGWLGGVMLVMFNGIVFAGAQFGIAIMRLGSDNDEASGGGMQPALRPVPVVVRRGPPRR
ncbi:hypothetical protein FHG66_04750 [Rubellimicrobium rubrum]|uniref:Uncharacterized protein n=1 Tax=Rubellimicrobium rubrum TaxID=2585369 RepID=A0A5C4N3B8_9RHOB|nr:hypothetical protein [Rubellimicrobium rubrum]TNC51485.1 hypothetical protein FHG66_04750 [Rubellimicrobium rubrum]